MGEIRGPQAVVVAGLQRRWENEEPLGYQIRSNVGRGQGQKPQVGTDVDSRNRWTVSITQRAGQVGWRMADID